MPNLPMPEWQGPLRPPKPPEYHISSEAYCAWFRPLSLELQNTVVETLMVILEAHPRMECVHVHLEAFLELFIWERGILVLFAT